VARINLWLLNLGLFWMVFETLFVLGVEAFSRPGRVESGYFSRVNGRGEADAPQ
jgi:hypothetical protein